MDEHQYKVERQLAEVMPRAAEPKKARVSFDLRLSFREDDTGYKWAEVAFLDRNDKHKIIDHMPLKGDDVVPWFFAQIAELGYELAVQLKKGA
jgi:hypothetical protein